jgi:hypothetical protein
MKTLKNLLFLFALLISNIANTQSKVSQSNAANSIALVSVVSDEIEGLNESSRKFLENKLNRIVSNNGIVGSSLNQRFIITSNVIVISKELTTTAPPMQAYNLEVSFLLEMELMVNCFHLHP